MILDTLPLELLRRIFEYLPADDLWLNLRAVNRSLNHEIRDASYWMKRANRRFDLHLPARLNPQNDNFLTENEPTNYNIEHSHLMPIYRCVATERVAKRCADDVNLYSPVTKMDAHFGTIDAIKLFKTGDRMLFCLSGGRDSQIRLWNMQSAVQEDPKSNYWTNTTVQKAHDGWIWSISPSADGEIFYSAGWDTKVKQWRVAESEIMQIDQIGMKAAALCCISEGQNLLFVSTYRNGPILFDLRAGLHQPQAVQNCHGQRPVFNLATGPDSNQIFSIADDNQLIAVDKRNFQHIVSKYHTDVTISHLDYAEGQLCVGLRDGHLLFFDPNNLQIETTLQLTTHDGNGLWGHQNIRINRGATFCSSSDNMIRVFSPGLRPNQMASIELSNIERGDIVNRMDVLGDHIVAAMPGGNITFWPGQRLRNEIEILMENGIE